MLDSFKRWIAGGPDGPAWRDVADWARQRGAGFKRAHDDEGFVVDAVLDARPWRLEWGPPQRGYIEGHELRLRIELGLSQNLQMLLLSRPLFETLERQTFETYTATTQTHIDVSTPEEMRWLAMYPKVPLADRDLRNHFGAVAWSPTSAAAWLDGPVSQRLAEARLGPLCDDPALVLMTLRGRVYLRLQLAVPEVATLEAMAVLFETAAVQAVHVAGARARDAATVWPSTASTAWQTQLLPDEGEGRSRN